MNVLEVERRKLALLREDSVLLFPHTLSLVEEDSGHLVLTLLHAEEELKVLVTLDSPLDWHLLTSSLLTPGSMEHSAPPQDHSLPGLVRWLVQQVQECQETTLSTMQHMGEARDMIDRMLAMKLIEKGSYQLVTLQDRVKIVMKFKPELEIKLASLGQMVRKDRLGNHSDHFYCLRLVFRADGSFLPGQFAFSLSETLSSVLLVDSIILPNFDRQGELVPFILATKEALDEAIRKAVAGWRERAQLVLSLFSMLLDVDAATPYVDHMSMTQVVIAFRSDSKKFLLKVKLAPDYPATAPSLCLVTQRATQRTRARELKEKVISGEEELQPNLSVQEYCTRVVHVMDKLAKDQIQ